MKRFKFGCWGPVTLFFFALFFTLKVVNVLNWSWFWVCASLWIVPASIGLGILGIILFGLIIALIAK